MSKYYRGSLPDGEDDRLHEKTLKVLRFLQEGPKTNAFFAAHGCLDYRKRCNELRRHYGLHIKAARIKGGKGLFEYRLLDKPEPEWEVVIKSIAPDEQFMIYPVIVNALTATEARNNAPRKFVRNEIVSVRKLDSDPPPTDQDIIRQMMTWFLANYEDPAESTPVDDGAYVYIWGDPVSPHEALQDKFCTRFSDDLIEQAAEQLCKEHDIFEWVPVPVYEDDAGEDGQDGGEEAPH